MFYRNLTFMEHGIKPIWVFDGEPPKAKQEELNNRSKIKEAAKEAKTRAEIEGDDGEEVKQAKRSIKVTNEMVEQVKEMLNVLGVPFIQAKSEAEAQCALLNKKGLAFGVASEDLDSLVYGANVLLRHFKNDKKPVIQIELQAILNELALTHEQFVSLCILCGSDYTEPIKGIGPVRALGYVRQCKTLSETIEMLKTVTTKSKGTLKYKVPEGYSYDEALNTFNNPDVTDVNSLQVIL